MSDAIWRMTGNPFGGPSPRKGHRKTASVSRTAAMKALGAVVYAARLADGTIKIGWTEHFDQRIHWLKNHVHQDVELLAFRPGTYEDEQVIHGSLVAHRIEGKREYYAPTPEVLGAVNEMRAAINMPPIAA